MGLGDPGTGLIGEARFGRHLVERVEVSLESSAHLLGRKRLARRQIDGMIVAAQSLPGRFRSFLSGLTGLHPLARGRFRCLGAGSEHIVQGIGLTGFPVGLAGVERFARLIVEAAAPFAAAMKPGPWFIKDSESNW